MPPQCPRHAHAAFPSPFPLQTHIIILVQTADDSNSRTYLDFAAPAQAWDAITRMYEERLKVITPGVKSLSYDVHDLFRWLDNLADISCLVCVTYFYCSCAAPLFCSFQCSGLTPAPLPISL